MVKYGNGKDIVCALKLEKLGDNSIKGWTKPTITLQF